MLFGGQPSWFNYLLPNTKFNYAREVGDGLGSSVIMGPVLWIARTFPEAPLALELDKELIQDHEMLDLIRKPNPYYSGHVMAMATITSFSMQGNAYWLKLRNNQGKVIQLWYTPHWMLKAKWPDTGTEFISHYEYTPKPGTKIRIEIEDVVHFRYGLDPRNIRLGLSPLGSLMREVFTDDEAANFTASLLKNMGVPGIVIGPGTDDGTIDPKDKRAIKRFWRKMFSGDNRGEPMIMSGKTDVHAFGFSPQEMDLSRLREIPEERVTAILGIPAAVVGFGTGLQQTKVGATMSEMREMAYESCIIPMQRLTSATIENDLLPDFEGEGSKYRVTYDLSNVRVLQEDQNKKAVRMNTMVGGGWTLVSEARKEMGLEVGSEHEIYLRPFNLIVVPAGVSPEEQTPIVTDDNGNGKTKNKVFLPMIGTKDNSELIGQQLLLQFHQDWLHLSKVFADELESVFNSLGQAASDAFRKIMEDRGIESFSLDGVEKKEITEEEIVAGLVVAAIVTDVLDYTTQYIRVTKQTYKTINSITGLGIEITEVAQLRILAAAGTRKGLIDLSIQSKKAVFQSLQESLLLGEDVSTAAGRISNHVARGRYLTSETRAMVIARTETKFAQNMSGLEAYNEGGVTQVRVSDGRLTSSDDFCIERDGDILTLEEAQTLDEHPNGTLSFIPIVQET